MYGTNLAGPVIIVIFVQLIITGIIVMLMDELVQKGWGLGSGISLFIMAGVAQNIVWSTFSPPTGLFVGSLSAYLGGQQSLVQWAFGSAGRRLSITAGLLRHNRSIPDSNLLARHQN